MKKKTVQSPQSPSSSRRKPHSLRKLLPEVLLVCTCLIVYGRTLYFQTTGFDDDSVIHVFSGHSYLPADAFTHNAFMLPKGNDLYRPFQSITFMADGTIFGGRPFAYRLTSLLLHCLTVICLLHFLLLVGFDRRISFVAALAYAVHPLLTQAVVWIPGRGDLLLGLSGLLAFIMLIQFRRTGKFLYLAAHAGAFLCAVFAKENGIVLPILFAAFLAFFDRIDKPGLKPGPAVVRSLLVVVPIWALIAVFYLLLRNAGAGGLPEKAMFGIGPLLSNLRVVPETVAGLMLPFDVRVIASFSLLSSFIGLVLIAGLVALLAVQHKLGRPMVLLGALWFVSLMIPGMMFRHELGLHAYDYLNHRAYLPIVGVFLLLLEAVPKRWISARRSFGIGATTVVAVLAVLAFRQSGWFSDTMTFFNHAVQTNPSSALALNNRGTFRALAGDLNGAERDYSNALRLFPDYFDANKNRANARKLLGNLQGSLADFNHALRLRPGETYLYDSRAELKVRLGDLKGAISDNSKAIALDSSDARRYYIRGHEEEITGDTTGALTDYRQATRIDPHDAGAFNNRGVLLYRRGDLAAAAVEFQSAIDNSPGFSNALFNLGLVKFRRGDRRGACALWHEAAALGYGEAAGLLGSYCK